MLIIQLFVFALLALGFGLFSMIKRKKFVGVLFLMLGIFLFLLGIITVYFYPHTLPW